jgi:phosphoribosylanthranilate isomerase
MRIDRLTITGPDDKTNIKDLIDLSEAYPFVEWGILFSKNRTGTHRYPNDSWIKEVVNHDMKLSAHFCGWWAKQVLENTNYDLIKDLHQGFERIQLNYNFGRSTGWDLGRLLSTLEDINSVNVILQNNKSNNSIIMEADIPNNVHVLFDASGGRGTEIKEIRPTIKGLYTGYAGGLNPENIDNICQIIGEVDDDNLAWIDLESGVRTNNEFDLSKVEDILGTVSKYITTSMTHPQRS